MNLDFKPQKPKDAYRTPVDVRAVLDMEFGFDLDPCPYNENFDLSKDVDGLKLNWDGHRVFVNPPWSKIGPWVAKAFQSHALVVMLLPNRTDTEWFADLYHRGAELRFWKKRLKFTRDDGDILREDTKPRVAIPVDGTIVAVIRRLHLHTLGAD
jgi:hypothetical protein